MATTKEIKITIDAGDNFAVLTINGASRYIDPEQLKTEVDLRNLLRDQPDYIYNAVVAMLKEMVS